MNRTPVAVTSGSATANASGRVSGSSLNATTTSRGTAFTIRGQEGRNEILPPNITEFVIDPERKRELRLGAVTVAVVEYDETSLRYTLAWDAKE